MKSKEITAMQDAAARAELEEKRRQLTTEEVSAMLIRQQINTLTVDDQTALRMVEYYPAPDAASYAAGDRIQYNGKLYKCLQAHTAQADWNPVDAPSLWAEVLAGQDGTAIGEWEQPDSTNPYMRGDRVSYNGSPAKYDLRSWRRTDGEEKLLKGLTLTDEEARALKEALNSRGDL